ncbi:hypothetical protein HOY82DRAFT_27415 [Tuber indicum]|nr:hypothetical protein HOY82DRAFT_27415 [Tuber indicum]
MYVALTTLLLATAAASVSAKTGNLGDSKVHTNNSTTGKQFIASLHGTGAHGSLHFNLTNFNNKTGVFVKLDLTVYHGDEGLFKLSLYEAPVGGNGKCDGAKNVLDPFQRGDKPECDRKEPQTCQVGDLVGKHGEIPKFQGVISVKQSFQDLYLSFRKEEKAFIGNGSVIVKNAEGDKIACANIMEVRGAARTWKPKGNGAQPGHGEGPGHGSGFGRGGSLGGGPHRPPSTIGGPFMPEWFKGNGKGNRYKPREHKSRLSRLLGFHRGSDDYFRGHHHHHSNP